MSAITTHILDTSIGLPAAGVRITLEFDSAVIGEGTTDADGRLRTLLSDSHKLAAGVYKITFETGSYFASRGVKTFYPKIAIDFEIEERARAEHYHVPVLVSPFGYQTYRGS